MDTRRGPLHRAAGIWQRHAGPRRDRLPVGMRRALRGLVAASVVALLAACGGSGGGDEEAAAPQDQPSSREDAARFLTQATYGPTDAELGQLQRQGYRAWIEDQLRRPHRPLLAYWDAAHARIKAADASRSAGQTELLEAFYQRAVAGDTQLRDRLAYALSQIFVVSTMDGTLGSNTRMVASYYDMLAARSTGSFRSLLEGVTLHPAMGIYLSHLRNEKENSAGRVPDQNYAREVMQLFSIGLYQLNLDGTPKLDGASRPIETYTSDDIVGLSYVLTGFSWAGPDTHRNRFYERSGYQDPNRHVLPMQAYPEFHSLAEKRFLGVTIARRSGNVDAAGLPEQDLRMALDTLANHPNVAPFMSKQLIQRLVTSNPSPAYVARVATVFNRSGGNLKEVAQAILLDPEARDASLAEDPGYGKLREPVLRLTAVLRAFGARSDSGRYTVNATDDSASSLGQTPLRAPSVFNFYRPGYVPPNTELAAQGRVAPEMQLVNETTVAGYANYLMNGLRNGFGATQNTQGVNRADLQFGFTDRATAPEFATHELRSQAGDPAQLVETVNQRLLLGAMSDDLRAEIVAAVGRVSLPALRADNGNAAQVETARRRRIMTAIFLAAISPEFLVQK